VVNFTTQPLFPLGNTPGTPWIGGRVDPTTGLDDVENRKFSTLSGLELRPLGRPSRSQSLYRLRYPGSLNAVKYIKISTPCRELNLVRPTLARAYTD
jgi:hypothetical protein